jgi:hypothetical protein
MNMQKYVLFHCHMQPIVFTPLLSFSVQSVIILRHIMLSDFFSEYESADCRNAECFNEIG